MTPELDLIGLVTTDLARSLEFYRRLGLEIPSGAEQQPHVEVTLPGGLRLAWDDLATIRSFDPDWTPPVGSSRTSLAFRCAEPAEVDRWYAELTAAGHHGHRAPWDAVWGQRYAVLHDPDGNAVDLFAALPAPPE
ncbi:VOC family protein [Micromonospora radicis]|uniref:Glyoxalase n=1 Tax=Micromonospora radicis TaxID=1894971 RepID=A0A418N0L2_9ACTN|nr:VOC family protein [Micromonospora radicis]RIV41340.1 glyoxalase [Micromonospora radicis]